jgi:hypothetical protein
MKPTPGGQNFCFPFGHTVLFEPAALTALYPWHDAFVRKFTAAVNALERDGYWLKPEADAARKAAEVPRRKVARSAPDWPRPSHLSLARYLNHIPGRLGASALVRREITAGSQ